MRSLVHILKHCSNVVNLVNLRRMQWHLHDTSGYNTSGKLPAENMFGLLLFFYFMLHERFSVLDNLGSKRLCCFVSGDFAFNIVRDLHMPEYWIALLMWM